MANMYQDGFAGVYDRLMRGGYSHAEYADYIERIFGLFGASPSIVVDLGCGTGSLCVELRGRGYDMIGIDSSQEMLNIALGKAAAQKGGRDILFLNQDICDFELYGTAGAILSTIDSMNYLTARRQLNRVFALAGNYLDPGGLFVFDLNTRHKLSRVIGGNLFYEISDDVCYLWENSYDSAGRISTFDLTFFVRNGDGTYSRHDERHRQRAHSDAEIAAAARLARLAQRGVYDCLTFDAPGRDAQKICYVFQKERP
ncbi:MAG: class I SAM-dependent methyltransferase [Clostridiales bacterium]|jgi:SAM-dependent methyltransferase|nr:class I SAM-dependent methyltransferase [Clostridiales bacterium]